MKYVIKDMPYQPGQIVYYIDNNKLGIGLVLEIQIILKNNQENAFWKIQNFYDDTDISIVPVNVVSTAATTHLHKMEEKFENAEETIADDIMRAKA